MTTPFARWKWLLVLVIGLVVWQVVLNAGVIVAIALDAANQEAAPLVAGAIGAVLGLVLLAASLHLLYRWPGGGLTEIGLTARHAARDAALGIGVGAATAALSVFVVLPLLGEAGDEMLNAVAPLLDNRQMLWATLLLLVVRGGIVEEMFFRGHIIRAARGALGGGVIATIVAVALSVVLFAFAHRYQGMVGVATAAVFAVIWAGLYLATKRLAPSIWAHASHDVLALLGIIYLLR